MDSPARVVTPARVEWADVLRGAAALAVVLFHVRVTMWVGFRALYSDAGYSAVDRAMAWITLPFPFFGTAVMLFFVVSGRLTIQLRDRDVVLNPNDVFVVPRGVEHCPKAEEEVHAILFEPKGTVNTGDAGGDMTAELQELG